MTRLDILKRASAMAVAAGLAAAPAVAVAQDATPAPSAGAAAQVQAPDADTLIAKVGDAEIRGRDVTEAISSLPPQVRQQAGEQLVPMAVDQLVTRQLILQEARADNLSEDEEVTTLAETADASVADEDAREQAMIQVWLKRELDERVSEDDVTALYDQLKAANPDAQVPPLDQVRPQVEQRARQMAFAEVRTELQKDADVTFYGPDGEPLERPQGG